MSDIVLIYPRTGMDIGSSVAPPHNLLCVAAPLDKAGYKVKIIDQRVDPIWMLELKTELNYHPIFVGIPTMTGTQIKFAMEIAQTIREYTREYLPNPTPIVWGGAHSTLLPEQILESGLADYVVKGEIEDISLLDKLNGNKIIETTLPDMSKLLPTPWHLVDVEKYIHSDIYLKKGRFLDVGQTSRGCPFQCGFCSSASIRQRKWRAMSAEQAVEMITKAVVDFKLNGVWLRDDEFYISSDRVAKIAERLIPLNITWYTSGTRVDVFNKTPDDQIDLYKKAGAGTLKFGAESGCNRILELMNKGITKEETLKANLKAKKHGITPAFALMLGFPSETFEEMEETIDMARQIRKDNPQAQFETMATYTALPGTPMWNTAIKYGLKSPTKLEEWADWNFDEYDYEGKRIPWFNKKERIAIGNICYLSMLSNAVPNVIDSLDYRKLLQLAYALPHKYFQWRFFNKHYRRSYELSLIHKVREKVFYNGDKVLR